MAHSMPIHSPCAMQRAAHGTVSVMQRDGESFSVGGFEGRSSRWFVWAKSGLAYREVRSSTQGKQITGDG